MADEVLEIKIQTVGVQESTTAIESLTKAVKALARATNTDAIVRLNRNMVALNASLSQVTEATVAKFERLAEAFSKMGQFGGKSININTGGSGGSSSSGGSTKTKTPLSDEDRELIEFGDSVDVLYRKLEELKVKLHECFDSGNVSGAISTRQQIDSVTAAINKATERTKELSKTAEKTSTKTTKSFGKLASAIGRVAFYRIVRSLIKFIEDAIKEGIENIYNYSKQIGGSFADAMDSIATKAQTMKNQLGAAVAEIIELVRPFVELLIEKVTRLAELVTQFFAALNGKKTYKKAIEYAKEWKDTAEEGSDAAEEWKNQLLGFDEINKLEDNDSGSGSSFPDYSNLYEEVPLEQWAMDLSELMSGIYAWFDELEQKIVNFFATATETVTEFLEGLVTDLALYGEQLWTAIENFGQTVAEGVSQWWEGLKTGVSEGLTAIQQSVSEFWQNLQTSAQTNMETIRTTVSEKLNEINTSVSELLEQISTGLNEKAETIKETLNTLSKNLNTAINNMIENGQTAINNAKKNINSFCSNTYKSLATWGNGVITVASSFAKSITSGVYQGLKSAWSNINAFVKGTFEGFKLWANGVVSMIASAMNGILQSVSNAAKSMFNTISKLLSKVGKSLGSWWSDNSTWVIPTAIAAVVVGGAIALAPESGGLSLAAIPTALAGMKAYANGGTPATGSLFIAGEAGAELVSSAGGHTSVSNQDQIANSVEMGNGVLVNAIYAMSNAIVNSIDKKDTSTYIDGKEMAYSLHKYDRAVNKTYGSNLVTIN